MCNIRKTLKWPTIWLSSAFLGSIHDIYDDSRTFRWPTMWSSWALWHQDPLASGLIGLGRPSVLGAIRTKLCNKHKTLRYGQNFEERAKLWNTDKTLQYRHNCAIRIQFCIWHQRQEMCKYMSVCVVSMSWVWVKVCMNVCMLWQVSRQLSDISCQIGQLSDRTTVSGDNCQWGQLSVDHGQLSEETVSALKKL